MEKELEKLFGTLTDLKIAEKAILCHNPSPGLAEIAKLTEDNIYGLLTQPSLTAEQVQLLKALTGLLDITYPYSEGC